jgi:hypothetical protein
MPKPTPKTPRATRVIHVRYAEKPSADAEDRFRRALQRLMEATKEKDNHDAR